MYVRMYMHSFSHTHVSILQPSREARPPGELNHKSCCLCPGPQAAPRQLWSGHLCLMPMPLLTERPPLSLPLSPHLWFGLAWYLCTVLLCSKFPLPSRPWGSCQRSYLRARPDFVCLCVCWGVLIVLLSVCINPLGS